ncbi:MAG: recombinase family protein [Clostridia bacterium]|nr:recombinase family protein [Clostridia bacterium]
MLQNIFETLNTKGITRIYAYSRKSRDVEGEGLQKHHDIIVDFCSNLSIPLEKIYEEVESSETLTRPTLSDVREQVKNGDIRALVVYRLDRLTRKTTDLERLLQEFKFYNLVLIEAHRGKIVDYNDTLSTKLESVMSDLYQEQSKLVLNAGKKKAVSIYGNHLGEAPLGYTYNPKTKKLEANEQAFLIRLIFNMYVEGKSTTAIAVDLNKRGYRTRKGVLFNSRSIHIILNNEKYIGTQIYGKREWYKDINGKEMSKEAPKEDWIIYENAHEPIIDNEQFLQVKKLLKDKLLVPVGARKRKFSLSNVLKCGKCGRNMVFHHVNGKEYLKPCVNLDFLTGQKCGNGAIPIKDIEEYLKSQIWSVARPAILHMKRKRADGHKYRSEVDLKKEDLLKQQRDINLQLDNILDLMIQRGVDQRLLDREQSLKSKLRQIESQVNNMLAEDEDDDGSYPEIAAFLKDTEDLSALPWKFKCMTSEEKNVLFKRYIKHVTYLKNPLTLDITWTAEVQQGLRELVYRKEEVRRKKEAMQK